MKNKFTTGAVVRAINKSKIYKLVECPVGNLMAYSGGFRQRGLECYCGEGFYCACEPDVPKRIVILQEDDIEFADGIQSGPYFVERNGRIFSYKMHSPTEIILSDGNVIGEPECDNACYVTLASAVAMSKAVRSSVLWEEAKLKHREWVEEFTGVKHVPPGSCKAKFTHGERS